MRLLRINMARCVWLLPTKDLNPRGSYLGQEALNAVAERYTFSGIPTFAMVLQAARDNTPLEFASGKFVRQDGQAIEITLKIYIDGFVAETRSSTDDSAAFLDDFISWLPRGIDLPLVSVPINQKLYLSEVYVALERSPIFLSPAMQKFAESLTKTYGGEKIRTIDIGALNFWTDPASGLPMLPFRLEREADRPFAENRYFAQAPLPTDEHLRLLQGLSDLI